MAVGRTKRRGHVRTPQTEALEQVGYALGRLSDDPLMRDAILKGFTRAFRESGAGRRPDVAAAMATLTEATIETERVYPAEARAARARLRRRRRTAR